MSIPSDRFRDALRHFPAGVTLVTLRAGGEIHGLTVSAFASVSPDPPLVAVMIDHRHRAFERLELSDAVFAVNFLGEDQQELSERFAWGAERERFGAGNWESAVTGAPVLADAVAWLDCTIHSRHRAGSHTLFIGEVQASHVARPDAPPLIYWNRAYRALAADSDRAKE
jgi:flavin reductase (DIM6/NTAB) family NADH-FMN oxidoreductase RutF